MKGIIFVLMIAIVINNCVCDEKVREIAKFCSSQNMQKIAIVTAESQNSQIIDLVKALNKEGLRCRVQMEDETEIIEDNNHYIFMPNSKSSKIWQMVQNSRIQSSLVILESAIDLEPFFELERLNALFYVFIQKEEEKWLKICSLQREQQLQVQKLSFQAINGKQRVIKEEHNASNMTLSALGLTYNVEIILEDCSDEGLKCKIVSGIIPDLLKIIANVVNITVDYYREPNNEWGTMPILDQNGTKQFSGILGSVVRGQKDLGLAFWLMFTERVQVLDFIPIYFYNTAIVYKNERSSDERDSGYFLRPFTSAVWYFLAFLLIVSFLLNILITNLIKNEHSAPKQILQVSLALCFVVLQQHYEGVITMQAATQEKPLFQSVDDVLRAYPHWDLIVDHGFKRTIGSQVESEVKAYNSFLERLNAKNEESLITTIEQGMKKVESSRSVYFSSYAQLQRYLDKNRNFGQNLKVLALGHEQVGSLLMSKNHPLGPDLKFAALKLFESGSTQNIMRRWIPHKNRDENDNHWDAVALGQVGMAMALMAVAAVCSLVILALELKISMKNCPKKPKSKNNF